VDPQIVKDPPWNPDHLDPQRGMVGSAQRVFAPMTYGSALAGSSGLQFSPEPTLLRPWRRGGQILNFLFPQWVGSDLDTEKTGLNQG
jgi:hypothetical protein